MKTLPALERVVGQSHQALHRADVYTHAGVYVATLPLVTGTVKATARGLARWSGHLSLAGDEYLPVTADDYLSGLSQHHVRLYSGAVVDTAEQWVEVARLLIASTRIDARPDSVAIEVDLIDLGGYLDMAAEAEYTPTLNQSCQAMIKAIVAAAKPPGWPTVTWTDDTTTVSVPTGAKWEQATPGLVIQDLASIADVGVYIDADGNGVIRDPLPDTFGTAQRTLSVSTDVLSYTQNTGRWPSFANTVELTFSPVGASSRARLRGSWSWSASAGAPSAGQIRYTDSGTTGELRVDDDDSSGYNREKRQLERLSPGDIVEVRTTAGAWAVYAVTYAVDQSTYYQLGVDVLSDSGSAFPSASAVELAAYFTPTDNVVGTAVQTSGLLGTSSAGAVVHREYHIGNVTQAQANARAATLLPLYLRGWSVTVLQCVPDARLEVDDDVTVVYLDGTARNHRVTEVEMPLGTDRPMSVAVRTFGGT